MDNKEYKNILSKMCNLCARGEKCEFDINQKLIKYEVNDENRVKIIGYLFSNNYLNQKRYTDAYVNDKFKFNKWGKQKIRQNLKFKNIETNCIETSLSNLNFDDYRGVLISVLKNKRRQIKNIEEVKIRRKLVDYAISKGFEHELIVEIINEYKLSKV